jgi:DNA processing protein
MWGPAASERIVARLSGLTVVVEAAEVERELFAARVAGALGRPLAAVPGRVTSHLSAGSNGLLAEGARVVRGAQDVLDLLYPTAAPRLLGEDTGPRSDLAPRLRTTLEEVGSGCDTPDALAAKGASLEDVLLALSELELMGLLSRGDGGRYIPRGARGPL